MRVVTLNERQRLTAPQRAMLATEIVLTYCRARWWLFRLSFPACVAAAREVPRSSPTKSADDAAAATRFGRAVARTLRPLPVDSRCLVVALVVTRMLARRGIASTFVLGVRARPTFAAHAWVEQGGIPVLPAGTEFERLTEL
jgi:hypothetical protein